MEPLLFFETHWLHEHHLVVVCYTWFVMGVLALLSVLATRRMNILPGGVQNVMEVVIEGFDNLLVETMGPEGRKFFPLIATLGLYILTVEPPRAHPGIRIPDGQSQYDRLYGPRGLRHDPCGRDQIHGFKYVKHFLGPIWWLAPLMLVLELISHLARVISLSVRLFGNIMGEDKVLAVVVLLVPFLVPLPVFVLMIFTSFIQTIVFMLLAMMYIAGAMAEAH